jgi:hypothetical protein
MDLPGTRATGHSVLHISNPWTKPANASISNVKMIAITSLAPLLPIESSIINTPTQLTPLTMGYVKIPANYSLSFNIKPLGVLSEKSSIIHFTNNEQQSTQLPAIWFLPNTNNLSIRFSGTRVKEDCQ